MESRTDAVKHHVSKIQPWRFVNSEKFSYSDKRELVHRVITMYAEVCSLPRITTFVLKDTGLVSPQRSLTPGSIAIHYKADCEKITERALTGRPDLQETFWDIAQGETPGGLSEVHVVQKLHKAYRVLDPFKYFRPPVRRGSVESQRMAA